MLFGEILSMLRKTFGDSLSATVSCDSKALTCPRTKKPTNNRSFSNILEN